MRNKICKLIRKNVYGKDASKRNIQDDPITKEVCDEHGIKKLKRFFKVRRKPNLSAKRKAYQRIKEMYMKKEFELKKLKDVRV